MNARGSLLHSFAPGPRTALAALVGLLATAASSAAAPVPTPIGVGPLYHPPPTGRQVAAALPVGGFSCERDAGKRYGVHLELFANRRVVLVPAGVGIAPPLVHRGAYVLGGRCSYPVRTREPTGVIEVRADTPLTLGELFAVWGQALSTSRLVGFDGAANERVRAFVAGKLWRGDPRAIPLHRHAQIVLELGGYVPPHRSYLFRDGL